MIDKASAISNFTAKRNFSSFFFFNYYYPIILPNEQWYFLRNVLVLLERAKLFFLWKNLPKLGIEQNFFLIMKIKSWKEFGEIQETKSMFENSLFTLNLLKYFIFSNIYVKCVTKI